MLKNLELCLMRNHLRTYKCSHLWSAVVVVYPSESLLHLSFKLPPKKQLMFTLSDVSHRLGGGGAGTGSAGEGRRKEDHKLWSCSRLVVRIRDHLHLLSIFNIEPFSCCLPSFFFAFLVSIILQLPTISNTMMLFLKTHSKYCPFPLVREHFKFQWHF